jgi:hypothetical protein
VLNNTSGNDAFITFHVSGDFAGYFGMGGAENDLVVGGFSYGANRYRIYHSGNIASLTLPNLTSSGYLSITAASDGNGNIRFSAANPYINASSYIIMPGGLYVSNGILYVQNSLHVRNSIINDTGSLAINGGSNGITTMGGGGFQATASTSGYQALYWGTTFANVARFTSKRATKDNIRTLTNVGDIVDALRPVTFVPKAVGEESDELRLLREADVQHGFIAEEVALVADGKLAVWEPDDVELVVPAAWRQPDMIALLVAEVKDLRKRVTDLENICGT